VRVAIVTPPGLRVARGEAVTISVDPEHLLLFPADVKVKEHADEL